MRWTGAFKYDELSYVTCVSRCFICYTLRGAYWGGLKSLYKFAHVHVHGIDRILIASTLGTRSYRPFRSYLLVPIASPTLLPLSTPCMFLPDSTHPDHLFLPLFRLSRLSCGDRPLLAVFDIAFLHMLNVPLIGGYSVESVAVKMGVLVQEHAKLRFLDNSAMLHSLLKIKQILIADRSIFQADDNENLAFT